MDENKKTTTDPKVVTHRGSMKDSAPDVNAASNVLTAIVTLAGLVGVRFIDRFVKTGRQNEDERNALIIALGIGFLVILVLMSVVWLELR